MHAVRLPEADQPDLTSGSMSDGRQLFHSCMTGFMCLIMMALLLLGGRLLLPVAGLQTGAALIAGAILFEVFAAIVLVLQIRDYCRIIRRFEYDGRALRFWTLGSSHEQVREVCHVARVHQGRGSASGIGYAIVFRDGKKLYLDSGIPNGWMLADRLRLDT